MDCEVLFYDYPMVTASKRIIADDPRIILMRKQVLHKRWQYLPGAERVVSGVGQRHESGLRRS